MEYDDTFQTLMLWRNTLEVLYMVNDLNNEPVAMEYFFERLSLVKS